MNNSATLDLMKSVNNLISDNRFVYKSKFDHFPKDAKFGNIITKDGFLYLFTNNKWGKWEKIDIFTSTLNSHKTTATASIYPKLCTQCGAPLHSNKCRFCDTEYC